MVRMWAGLLQVALVLVASLCWSSRSLAEHATSSSASSASIADEAGWRPSDNDELPSHHLRSLIEMAAGLGLGSVAYWLMQDRNVADWDNPTPQQRFTGEAWRLDNNSLAVNFIAHPFSGALAHSMARANHLDPLSAFAYSSLTSFLWEFVLEFKEKVSVNDLIATSTTGVPLGEFFYKLGLYLDTIDAPGPGVNTLRWTLGTGVALDRSLDARPPPHVVQRDQLGGTAQIWHEFSSGYGLWWVDSPGTERTLWHRAGFEGRLVSLPGYLGPRSFSRWFHAAELSEFAMGVEGSQHGAGVSFRADTLLGGYHVQQMSGSRAKAHGVAGTFGVSLAYDYLRSTANRYADFEAARQQSGPDFSYHVPTRAEQYAAVHLPGLALDWRVQLPRVEGRLALRAHPSFAGLGAPAFYDWARDNPEEKGKHILHRQGYFYGWGPTGSLRGQLRVGPLSLHGHASYGRYQSQNGLDRHVEKVTTDVAASGSLLDYGASLGVRVPGVPLSIGVGAGVRHWYSRVQDHERRGRALRRGVEGSIEF